MACQETWISEFTNLIVTCILTRVNSDEAVSSTNRFKAFTSKAFYGLLNSLKAAAIKAVELIFEALVYLLNSDGALVFFETFHGLLLFLTSFPTALIGLHFPVMGVSPLDTHFAIILFFIMATIVHGIACMGIKLLPQDTKNLPRLRFICLVSGIIAVELLVPIIISPFWLFMVNFMSNPDPRGTMHSYQQVYH